MFLRIFQLSSSPADTANSTPENQDTEAFIEEHKRLESIISDSENIWEEHTYQIAAGGLSITFAIFTYLTSHGVKFNWQMVVIWSLFAVSLILNYISHRISIRVARNHQRMFTDWRKDNKPFDEDIINTIYRKEDRVTNILNFIVVLFLCSAIIYTIIFTCCQLYKL